MTSIIFLVLRMLIVCLLSMKFIEFEKDKCDSCYKCLRVCPTKAISFNENNRKIVNDLCIKCGLCQASCPQGALQINSQVEAFEEFVKREEKVAVTLAPSFVGAFGLEQPLKIVSALRDMGFDIVEETAHGAEMIASYYDDVIEKAEYENVITSCCPSANYLVEQYYPKLIQYIAPVVSPMVAHGRSIKARYGEDTKVIFIGPCLAKMAEAEEMQGAIDAVLTFEELDKMFKIKNKKITEYDEGEFDAVSSLRGRAFPLGGSLRQKDSRRRDDGAYRFIHVEGIDSCKAVLNEMQLGNLKNVCVEINICDGSCVNGPDMPQNNIGRYTRETYLRKYAEDKCKKVTTINDREKILKPASIDGKVDISRTFINKKPNIKEPSQEEILQVLFNMGKYTKDDELNCNACGYKTCRDKARAVCLGYSDIESCLPYLREKAESMQSVMIENSPNSVIMVDKELNIVEVNPTFMRSFNPDDIPVIEMPVKLFIDEDLFVDAFNNKKNIYNHKLFINDLDKFFLVNIVYLEDDEMLLAFLTDISSDELRRREFTKVKEETLLKTQEVIDKQMRVAQEIASLLGETTAETKMSLRSLNELVLKDRGDF